MISFSRVNTIPGIPSAWWGLLGREISRTLRYRRPRTVGVQSLSLQEMQHINKQYRAKDRPTDVLSFTSEVQGRGEV
nr:rRNA maturation RNAse YbeY [Patescibacteria group bacterium]